MNYAPVLLFAYIRLDSLKESISSLQKCYGADQTDLILFSDGVKKEKDRMLINAIREYMKTIIGFKTLTIYEAEENKGLANSIINGVTKVLRTHHNVIVLEDDLIVSKNFLSYMNGGLEFYKNTTEIISISGYSPSIKIHKSYEYDAFFTRRSSSWGWAIWKDRWDQINWDISDYRTTLGPIKNKFDFFLLGCNLLPMINKQAKGQIDSWAIRFVFNQFKKKLLSLYPVETKIKNIGFGEGATHTSTNVGYNENLDISNKVEFKFPLSIQEDKYISKAFYFEYSIWVKIISKLKNKI